MITLESHKMEKIKFFYSLTDVLSWEKVRVSCQVYELVFNYNRYPYIQKTDRSPSFKITKHKKQFQIYFAL